MRSFIGSAFVALAMLAGTSLRANNIQVSNIQLVNHNVPSTTVDVQFNLMWENAWNVSYAPANWDAAWVFMKYRLHSTGQWYHAMLPQTGHVIPNVQGNVGLLDPSAPYSASTNPVVGVFVTPPPNTNTGIAFGLSLSWNYGSVGYIDIAEVRVFAIEMVYVPQGAFAAGSGGSEVDAFTLTTINTGDATAAPSGSGSLGGEAGGYPTGQVPPTNANWPNGYKAFYCMKYEISQQQYVEFLNTLTRDQQNTRTYADVSGTSMTNRYVMTNWTTVFDRNCIRCDATLPAAPAPITFYCDLNGNGIGGESDDGQWIACNFLRWGDIAAYLDWSGLRPMTEMEFEKACRGTLPPVANEYPWGTTTITSSPYSLDMGGTANEGIASNYSTALGNAHYDATTGSVAGPLRVGVFAANGSNTGRVTCGASYYGIMELGGNVTERPVTIGNPNGRTYTGVHGNGELNALGSANALSWPDSNALGVGSRGGVLSGPASSLRVSDRVSASAQYTIAQGYSGGRGVRSAP